MANHTNVLVIAPHPDDESVGYFRKAAISLEPIECGGWIAAVWPDIADVFVGREPLQGLKSLGEVVGHDEALQVLAKLVNHPAAEAAGFTDQRLRQKVG